MGKEHKELYHLGNLAKVIQNLPELYPNYTNDLDNTLKTIYKNQRDFGFNPVKYKYGQRHTNGRMYPIGSYKGGQSLPRMIRNTVLDDYVEIDVVSAQPTFLSNLMNELKVKTPYLDKYIKNKKTYTKNHPEYKECVNSCCNADFDTKCYKQLDHKPEWLIALHDELMNTVYPKIKEQYKEQINKIHKANAIGTFIHNLYEQYEERWRSDMLWFLDTKKPKVNTQNIILNHDGIYIPRKVINDDAITNLKDYLQKKNRILISVKDLSVFDLSSFDDDEVDFDEEGIADTDYDCAKAFFEYMTECGHHFIHEQTVDDIILWWFNIDIGQWINLTDNKTQKHRLFQYLEQCVNIDRDYKKKKAKMLNCIDLFLTLPGFHENFEMFKSTSCKYKLPFKNGIWNFATKQLEPFTKDVFFQSKIPIEIDQSFSVLDDTELYDKVYDKLIYGFLEPIQAEYWLKVVGRCVAGAIEDKLCYCLISRGNSGKSLWIQMLNNMFGGFTSTFNAGCLGQKNFNDDGDKSMAWLVSNRHSRISCCSEIDENMTLSVDLFKKLVGGGDKISGRKLQKNKVEYVPQTTYLMFMNDFFAKVSRYEAEMKRRINFIKPTYNYYMGAEYEKMKHLDTVKLADPDIKDNFCNNPKVIRMLLHIILNNYEHKVPQEPQCCIDLKDEYLDGMDLKTEMIEHIEITGNKKDVISVKKIKQLLEQRIPQIKNQTPKYLKDTLLELSSEIKYGSFRIDGKPTTCYSGLKIVVQNQNDDEYVDECVDVDADL